MTPSQSEELRAMRLIRQVIADGFTVSLYPEDDLSDPMHKDSTDADALASDIHACDMMTVQIRKDGTGATFCLVFGNDMDGPIADHTDNDLGNYYFDLIMPG